MQKELELWGLKYGNLNFYSDINFRVPAVQSKHSLSSAMPGKPASREVTISKALSTLLRHSAEKENIKISKEGYVNVADVVGRSGSDRTAIIALSLGGPNV